MSVGKQSYFEDMQPGTFGTWMKLGEMDSRIWWQEGKVVALIANAAGKRKTL